MNHLKPQLSDFSAVIVHLAAVVLLTHSCGGQSQMIGPSEPIVATVGDDVILPCHLRPAVDVVSRAVEWARPDLTPRFVHVRRDGVELLIDQNPSFLGRTSMSIDALKCGDVSLKLSKVRQSDNGTYRCYVPELDKSSTVQLVVGVFSPPRIGITRDDSGAALMLDCESAGWYPDPEVSWLDGEGHVLSAGPTETVRGPDDLYTVSSRVTVDKRHSNSFTCRVQQNHINQTRETHVHISDDFFVVQSSSSVPVITGLAVSLAVCVLLIFAVLFFVWKQKQNHFKTKRSHRDDTDKKEKNHCETKRAEDRCVTEEEITPLKGHEGKKNIHKHEANQEEQRREEAERKVQTLEEELKTKKTEVGAKQDQLQQLYEKNQRNKNELQNLNTELENKIKELGTIRNTPLQYSYASPFRRHEEQQEKAAAEREAVMEVDSLTEKLKTQQTESDTQIKEFDEKQAEVKQLQEEIQVMEANLQTLMEDLKFNNIKSERSHAVPARSSSILDKLQTVSKERFQEEQQKRREAQSRVQTLEGELDTMNRKLQDEQTRREKVEREVQNKTDELKGDQADTHRLLLQETQRTEEAQREVESLKDQLKSTNKELNDERTRRENAEKDVASLKKQLETQQGSITEFAFEVDPFGKFIRLQNTSNKDQLLENWELCVKINNAKHIGYRFEQSFKLRPGKTVTMWVGNFGPHYPPSDLQCLDLTSWHIGDKLEVTLFIHTEIRHQDIFTFS